MIWRTLAGYLALLLVLAVCLFVGAGTLEFWQAWLYLLVFGGSSAAITLFLWRADPELLRRRLDAGPVSEPTRTQQIIQSVASVAFIALITVPGLDRRFGWSRVPVQVTIVAAAVVVVGFYVVFLVFRANTFTSATVEVVQGQQVVSTGPYAHVRHPMYSGALLILLATPLALGSWWALLAWLPMLAAIIWRLEDEERYLLQKLRGYAEYRAMVRYRLVRGVW
ncbi:MAG: isoprenylcysteine carboxylmethyltransferase family protein [Chloroflexi bacterium]|nr:isoprenylcysteine carboxylmethyltransferase family protein [Chloroflexota bacterium]